MQNNNTCPNCGGEIQEGEFCPQCGTQNQPRPPQDPYAQQYPPQYPQGQYPPPPAKAPSMALSYISGIVYPIVFIVISLILAGATETAIWGLLAAMVCSVGVGVFFILGGFYFIIIPLPVIFIWKGGCVKPQLPTSRKVIYGFSIAILIALVFVFSLVP